jgi:hypothetical protein
MGEPQFRASDGEREAAIEQLRVAAAEGRLTSDELEERLEQAFAARTVGELRRLIADLPESTSVATPQHQLAAPPARSLVAHIVSRLNHIFGGPVLEMENAMKMSYKSKVVQKSFEGREVHSVTSKEVSYSISSKPRKR